MKQLLDEIYGDKAYSNKVSEIRKEVWGFYGALASFGGLLVCVAAFASLYGILGYNVFAKYFTSFEMLNIVYLSSLGIHLLGITMYLYHSDDPKDKAVEVATQCFLFSLLGYFYINALPIILLATVGVFTGLYQIVKIPIYVLNKSFSYLYERGPIEKIEE